MSNGNSPFGLWTLLSNCSIVPPKEIINTKFEETEARKRIQRLLTEWVERAIETLIELIHNFQDRGEYAPAIYIRSHSHPRPSGIPLIRSVQNYKTERNLDMTTIATFLSGVTASMIQVTASATNTATGVAANTFFFSSLVFSIGSAVNSLLVMSWRRSLVLVHIFLVIYRYILPY